MLPRQVIDDLLWPPTLTLRARTIAVAAAASGRTSVRLSCDYVRTISETVFRVAPNESRQSPEHTRARNV